MRRFVDTFYYVALLNPRDQWHDRVVAHQRVLDGSLITTDLVLVEVANTFAGSALRIKAGELVSAVSRSRDVRVLRFDGGLLERGLELYCARPDKTWSLTDCASFIVMGDERIQEALTADRHFEQAGFRALFCE